MLRTSLTFASKESRGAGRDVIPTLGAAVVCASGFGVLCVLWLTGHHSSGLRGLFTYASATVGDGILIPVLTGLLLAVNRSATLPRPTNEARWMAFWALLGGIGGISTQLAWLADDHPELNWTLPRPHHFNYAGTYHGVFLVLMSAALAALAAGAARRLHGLDVRLDSHAWKSVSGWGLAWAFGCGVGFVGLLAIDSSHARGTAAASTLLAIGVAAALSLALLAWAFRGRLRPALPSLGGGLVAAVALCLSAAVAF